MKALSYVSSPEATLEAVAAGLERGLVPGRIFGDPEIFELEIQRLFARSWQFVGHESEVPNPGDYVLRSIVRDSFLLVRGKDGQLRVLLNACRHRGTRFCQAERGTATVFRCPYHGWSYSNTGELLSVPGLEEYGQDFKQQEWGLWEVPRMDSYHGLIFVSLDPHAPDLADYLGDIRWYLDLVLKRSDAGLEVVGVPRRWVVNVNWKWPSDNFIGDFAHVPYVHQSAMAISASLQKVERVPMWSSQLLLGGGHGFWFHGCQPGTSLLSMKGYPESLLESLRRNLSPEQIDLTERATAFGGLVFPNLGIQNTTNRAEIEGSSIAHLSLELYQPLAADRTEIRTWFLVEKDVPPEFKQEAYQAYMRNFGAAGNYGQDDVDIWIRATDTAKGLVGGSLWQNLSTGLGPLPADPAFHGPGQAAAGNYLERSQRSFIRHWLEYLRQGVCP